MKFEDFLNEDMKQIAKDVSNFMKKEGLKVRRKSSSGKSQFIGFYNFTDKDFSFPVKWRNVAIDVAFGEKFNRQETSPVAGNIMLKSITLTATQWEEWLKRINK